MAFQDLREFIERLDRYGELQRIEKEVDWNLEAGAITRRANEIGAPAALMTRIKGYPEGYALLGSPFGGSKQQGYKPWRRVAIALEEDPDIPLWDLILESNKRRAHPLKPTLVSTGPCKENILMGKEVNLFKFPVPMIHNGDGGRYFSLHAVIAKDPDTDWVNWAVSRVMIQTRNKLGGHVIIPQHLAMLYYLKYEARNRPMPFCIALGGDPINAIVSSISVPYGVNEADIGGGFRREPLELIQAETNDLYVPASAEIVFEGEMRPNERWDEGPFGEYNGYMMGPRMPAPVYRINAITHRTNPIIPFCCAGTPVDDCAALSTVFQAAELYRVLTEEKGFPINKLYLPPEGIYQLVVVSTKVPYASFAKEIEDVILSDKFGYFLNKVMVVDSDIDPTDMDQVWHAFATRMHPNRGVQTTEHGPGIAGYSYLSLRERQYGLGAQVLYDCTWPKEWDPESEVPKGAYFANLGPPEIKEKVLKGWVKEYGYAREDYRVRG